MNKDAPYVTVVSMIAPSPDWFVSVRNVQLYKNGRVAGTGKYPGCLVRCGY